MEPGLFAVLVVGMAAWFGTAANRIVRPNSWWDGPAILVSVDAWALYARQRLAAR